LLELARQRCTNHAHREAVARCPECSRFFCRECATEHDGRVLCAACLAKLAKPPLARRLRLAALGRLVMLVLGFALAWAFFNLCGRVLLAIPSSFHNATFLEQVDE
jgi:uncharacterized paraquat-inducible protein A